MAKARFVEKRCGNCIHYKQASSATPNDGECRLTRPIADGHWPLVSGTPGNFCDEFEADRGKIQIAPYVEETP